MNRVHESRMHALIVRPCCLLSVFDAREGRAGAAVRSVRGSRAHTARTRRTATRATGRGPHALPLARVWTVERGELLLTRQSSLCAVRLPYTRCRRSGATEAQLARQRGCALWAGIDPEPVLVSHRDFTL